MRVMSLLHFKNNFKKSKDRLITPLVQVLHRAGVRANHLSLAALLAGLGAGIGVATRGADHWWISLLLIMHVIFDTLDGSLARLQGPSRYGYWIDFTVDRLTILALLVALALSNWSNLFILPLSYILVSTAYAFVLYRQKSSKGIFFVDGIITTLFIVAPLVGATRLLQVLVLQGIIVGGLLLNVIVSSRKLWVLRRRG